MYCLIKFNHMNFSPRLPMPGGVYVPAVAMKGIFYCGDVPLQLKF